MSQDGPAPGPGERTAGRAAGGADPDPWLVVSHLLAGVLLYGGLGWLLDRWLGTTFLVGVGILAGAVAAITLVWFRYGKAAP